jgi:hypothetical protein
MARLSVFATRVCVTKRNGGVARGEYRITHPDLPEPRGNTERNCQALGRSLDRGHAPDIGFQASVEFDVGK